jgi:hypothetical protein
MFAADVSFVDYVTRFIWHCRPYSPRKFSHMWPQAGEARNSEFEIVSLPSLFSPPLALTTEISRGNNKCCQLAKAFCAVCSYCHIVYHTYL